MKASLKTNKNLIRRFNKKLDNLASKKVEVGHFSGDLHPTAGVDYATLAKWMEYGTDARKADGSMGGIKAYRPLAAVHFMYPLKDDKALQKKILDYLTTSGVQLEPLFKGIGEEYERLLKGVYGDSTKLPSNALSTIREKGRDSPLVDTGLLKKAITYKIKRV